MNELKLIIIMKKVVTLLCIIYSLSALGVKPQTETTAQMNGMVLDIDWSGLVNQMQQPQAQPQMPIPVPTQQTTQVEYGVLTQAPVAQAPVAQETFVQEQTVEAVPEFMEVNVAGQIQIPNVNTLADLIVRSWANTWSMLAQDPNSSISLIYAGYKALQGVEGVHWRLVFSLSGSGNTEFIALDVAVLANGMIDIFRNIQTRNLTDISVLFGVNISASNSINLEYLKESFFHNSPMILNPDYNAAQANQTGFNIEWTRVEVTQASQGGNLNVLLNNLGGTQQVEHGVLETNVDIGSGNTTDDFDMFGA
jgi:hypothetical protein